MAEAEQDWTMKNGRPSWARDMLRGEFVSSAERMVSEPIRREALIKNTLRYGVGFLDDQLAALCSHDLVLLGASTGAGKTQMATAIAASNAEDGKRVVFFALEAEEDEIERRLKYQITQRICREQGLGGQRYVDWYLQRGTKAQRDAEWRAHEEFIGRFKNLITFYKSAPLFAEGLTARMEAMAQDVDLFVVDHLHYIDSIDENEQRAIRDMVARIRDMALQVGKPVVLVAHLRKREGRKIILPDLEDFHGSSNVVKIATHAIMLARAPHDPNFVSANVRRTLVHCPKDRRDGSSGFVALCEYDADAGLYRKNYQLGRVSQAGERWEPINHDAPAWARNHRQLTTGAL